jgi:hypothetical protein
MKSLHIAFFNRSFYPDTRTLPPPASFSLSCVRGWCKSMAVGSLWWRGCSCFHPRGAS